MNYLISFNESFRSESIKSDVEDIFHSEVDGVGFVMYDSVSLRGELVFDIRNEEQSTFTLVKSFKLGELDSFIRRLFLWAEVSLCEISLSYLDGFGFRTIMREDLASLGEKSLDRLIIIVRVF